MKKYRTRDGRDVVIHTEHGNDRHYPIVGEVKVNASEWRAKSWTKQGLRTLSINTHPLDLIEVVPYEKFPIDVKVWCWNNTDRVSRFKRHFAGVHTSGYPLAWCGGKTSFTETCNEPWDYMELAE